ncbi:SdpA family antimicrobial peptide system protein [Ornithinimicrobium pratense]|uniref:SdpA family antimicrobial peptide system protein n=1 Tax=Ornithinimicrobium pratense TaxID=2593973 RepID=A0A5J6V8Y7_9MICO|nr:SdpA family antimicrobial peptide system protein [Ornithinimicrobium pratense]QFG69462.1 SdpA family antimicrobial peptide system protein [Ornithinimicrobium pratense]
MAIETMAQPEVAATEVSAPPGDPGPARPEVKVPRVILLLCAAVLALVGVYDVKTHVPANILDLPVHAQVKPVLRATLPQGWAFFTRSPREENLRVYPVTADGLAPHVQAAIADPGHAFGLDRAVRAQGTESALVQYAAPAGAWVDCEGPRPECLEQALVQARDGDLPEVANPALRTTICGPVVLSIERAGAWAYRDLVADNVRSTQYAVVEATC